MILAIDDDETQLKVMRSILNSLTTINRKVLDAIISLFFKAARKSEDFTSSVKLIASLYGPVLLKPALDQQGAVPANDDTVGIAVVTFLLQNWVRETMHVLFSALDICFKLTPFSFFILFMI
jgi:hypothetical protein